VSNYSDDYARGLSRSSGRWSRAGMFAILALIGVVALVFVISFLLLISGNWPRAPWIIFAGATVGVVLYLLSKACYWNSDRLSQLAFNRQSSLYTQQAINQMRNQRG
jgi:uncharacterized membrane protein